MGRRLLFLSLVRRKVVGVIEEVIYSRVFCRETVELFRGLVLIFGLYGGDVAVRS